MPNGKLLEKLNKEGCEFSRTKHKVCDLLDGQYKTDMNGIGQKITLLLRWLIVVAIILIADVGSKIVPMIIKAVVGG